MKKNAKSWIVIVGIGIAVVLTIAIAMCLLGGLNNTTNPSTDTSATPDSPNAETTKDEPIDTTPWEDKPVITNPPIEESLPVINPPVVTDVVDTDDGYIKNDDNEYIPVKDLDKYITYDYSAIVNKDNKKPFKVDELNDMISNPQKYMVNMIDIEVTAEIVKYYNSLPEATRKELTLEEWMEREYLSQEVDLGVKIKNYDMSHIRDVAVARMYRSITDNTLAIVLAKDGFQTQTEYYQTLYELFMTVVKSLNEEELMSCVKAAKNFVSMKTIREKITEKDYDYLFNAFTNECIRLQYKADTWSFYMQNTKAYGQGGFYYPTVQFEYTINIPRN